MTVSILLPPEPPKEKAANGSDTHFSSEFSLTLRPSKTSIGLFFTDDKGKCTVTSIDPNGYAAGKIEHFRTGTQVIGVSEIQNERRPVKNFNEIRFVKFQ